MHCCGTNDVSKDVLLWDHQGIGPLGSQITYKTTQVANVRRGQVNAIINASTLCVANFAMKVNDHVKAAAESFAETNANSNTEGCSGIWIVM